MIDFNSILFTRMAFISYKYLWDNMWFIKKYVQAYILRALTPLKIYFGAKIITYISSYIHYNDKSFFIRNISTESNYHVIPSKIFTQPLNHEWK